MLEISRLEHRTQQRNGTLQQRLYLTRARCLDKPDKALCVRISQSNPSKSSLHGRCIISSTKKQASVWLVNRVFSKLCHLLCFFLGCDERKPVFMCCVSDTHTHQAQRFGVSVCPSISFDCGNVGHISGLRGFLDRLLAVVLLNDANLMFQLSAALPRSFSPGYMISEFVKRKEGTKHNHQNRWIIINSEGRPHVSLIMLVRHLGDPHFGCVCLPASFVCWYRRQPTVHFHAVTLLAVPRVRCVHAKREMHE